MPHPALVRAGAQVLAATGQPATLNGEDVARVHVAKRMRVVLGDVEVDRDVATIPTTAAPRGGQTLAHPDGTWVLDVRVGHNGINERWVLR